MRWLFLSLWLIAGAVAGQELPHGTDSANSPERYGTAFTSVMNAGMEKMMHAMHAAGHTGNADIDFLAMMIPHHEGAVEMAWLVLIHGRDPLTRKLAEDIMASQSVEIEGMKRRLAILRANDRPVPGEFPALGGTRGPGQQ